MVSVLSALRRAIAGHQFGRGGTAPLILGAVLGAVFLVALGETLRPLGDLATFIVSAVALVVVLFFPAGLLGMVKGVREAT